MSPDKHPGARPDLDALVREAEQRLIAREQSLHRAARRIGRQVQAATRPQRLLKPLLAGAIGVLALRLLWRRPAVESPRAQAVAAPQSGANGANGASWVRLAGLVWPLIPENLRARIHPTLVTTAMSVGPLLLEQLAARRPTRALRGVDVLDARELQGDWTEIAALPSLSLLPPSGPAAGQRDLSLSGLSGDALALRECSAAQPAATPRRARAWSSWCRAARARACARPAGRRHCAGCRWPGATTL